MSCGYEYNITNKHYHTLDYYLKSKYKQKVFKVPLNAPFTCPNRDGKKGTGGCFFCSNYGSSDISGLDFYKEDLEKQYQDNINVLSKKWPNSLYIVYFQSYTNTYGSVEKLKSIFEPFINRDNVIGLSIATRPDCINESIATYLSTINKRVSEFWVELGLQTANDKIAKEFNRGYDYSDFVRAVRILHKYNIKVIVHIINGLVNETEKSMLNTIKKISKLHLFGIKFHCLCLLKGSKYSNDENIKVLSFDKYLSILIKQIQLLDEDIIIHRLVSDASTKLLIAPKWVNDKRVLVNTLDRKLTELDIFQGDLYK